ncbi:MAG: hypothetical protein QXG39_07045, partial [Candidatus Aenigmatarchaeota archaeon]
MKRESAELIVKIIAILGIIGSVLGIVLAILGFAGSAVVSKLFVPKEVVGARTVLTSIIIVSSVILLIAAVFALIASINLLKFRNWARITFIVISVLGAIASLPSLIYGIGVIFLAIYIAIIYFLGFNKDVVAL